MAWLQLHWMQIVGALAIVAGLFGESLWPKLQELWAKLRGKGGGTKAPSDRMAVLTDLNDSYEWFAQQEPACEEGMLAVKQAIQHVYDHHA